MSNPAPTLNQINAFNATQGTTIDFNIIGGTEVIRSNKIYIYDLSDNSLICTHLYVSTESIHELPPNTSSSIVYASGKSSADFTNNTQYYAQIQTFTDVGGTQGGSGLSIAKLFWCLPTPTLTLSTIPTTISTTSYNVSATYTPNTSGGATNEIQEFQFNLYSAIGALLQTSGVVLYGEGVDLSYNFSGLEVDSTYYVTLDVTTTQGMNVSAQSNTFTVSIDTPTMGSASVVNNGCDGYISVTSNLSSEYEHEESVEAGEIMSFTTDSVNDITELDVDFSPVQDGTPWMSAQDTAPYMFRAVPSQTEDFGYESDTIVGGTVGWNQLVQNGNFADTSGWLVSYTIPLTVNSNIATFSATSSTAASASRSDVSLVQGHKYICVQQVKPSKGISYRVVVGDGNYAGIPLTANIWNTVAVIHNQGDTNLTRFMPVYFNNNVLASGDIVNVKEIQLIDLTAYFGTTIADYVYTLESGTAGAGVAWLRANAPQLFEYHAYDAGSLVSVSGLTSHDMVGFNALDKDNNLTQFNANTVQTTNNIKVVGGATYEVCFGNGLSYGQISIKQYDSDGNTTASDLVKYIGNLSGTLDANTTEVKLEFYKSGGLTVATVQASNPCLHLVWDASLNGTYKPYTKHSYPLDSSLTLRGIPKLDASNNLYYDGDVYESDGGVTKRFVQINIADLDLVAYPVGSDRTAYAAAGAVTTYGVKTVQTAVPNAFCSNGFTPTYQNASRWNAGEFVFTIPSATLPANSLGFITANGAYASAEAFKTAMANHGLIVEVATPTTSLADPYTNPQEVDPHGTEQYVGSPIPVGHETTYQRICPISGWDSVSVDVVGKNLCYKSIKGYVGPSSTSAIFLTTQGTSLVFNCKAGQTYMVSGIECNRYVWGVFDSEPSHGDTTTAFANAYSSTIPDPFTVTKDGVCVIYVNTGSVDASNAQVELGSIASTYTPYNGTTYPVSWQTEVGTVYGGTVDVVSGVLTVTEANIDLGSINWGVSSAQTGMFYTTALRGIIKNNASDVLCSNYTQVASITASTDSVFSVDSVGTVYVRDTRFNGHTAVQFKSDVLGVQLVYPLETPIEISLTPQQMQTLSGQNNVWSNTNGGMYLVYQLPITSLLVKRRDVADISGKWLTLYSTPITQASDMDFTFIDFLNQYGKTYQYALVPVLAQDQSGVVVQIEGGYTVSDNVDSIFDGVYIADQTNVERVKAGVGYGNIDMNQGVGSITPIGSKYPIVITNSQNQYHNGSIRGTIVPNDFYSNGNLSRIDMVNKRDELEQFLTNKRAKIIKDWNGKIWLVMIMSNVSCSFDDNYGMGMVSFSADWLEVGDPTNQQDLYNAGLINVGGV